MKKVISMVLFSALIAGALSSCIQDEPSSNASTTQAPAATTTQAPSTTSANTTSAGSTDAVTSASPKESSDPATVTKGLSKDGFWIFAILSDVTVPNEITVDGEFHDKGEAANKIYRKLALYAQDADHNVTAQYTLTVPKMTVNSPNFRIQNGTLKGDVYVNAEGFELAKSTIDGNLYFASQELMDKALLTDGKVTGKTEVSTGTDAVTSASPKESSDPATITKGLSKDGFWIFAILGDVTAPDEITVDGEFHDKGEAANKIYRKLALYAQDADHNVTAQYTLTVPKMTVNSPSFRIQNGTVKGDIYVNANGFELNGTTLEGNLYFKTQEFKDSFVSTNATINGNTTVGY